MNHKLISIFTTILLLAMALILAGTAPVAARSERIYFSGEDCPIYASPPVKQWVSEDGVMHQRSIQMTTRLAYQPDILNGLNYIVANVDIDLATNAVHIYGKVDIRPYVGEGSWVGTFSTHISPDGVIEGRAVAHGQGEFEGMTTYNTISSPQVPRPECNLQNTTSNGYILVPNP